MTKERLEELKRFADKQLPLMGNVRISDATFKEMIGHIESLMEKLRWARDALTSIAAEKCTPSFDTQLPKLERSHLISIIDTDTALAREALDAIGRVGKQQSPGGCR